jgi:hypothetical protein
MTPEEAIRHGEYLFNVTRCGVEFWASDRKIREVSEGYVTIGLLVGVLVSYLVTALLAFVHLRTQKSHVYQPHWQCLGLQSPP